MSSLINKANISPIDFLQSAFYLKGRPLRIPWDSMRHLHTIYNSEARSVMLKFGRQTHKSTTVGYKLCLPMLKYQSYHALYIAPTGNQVSTFSTDEIDGALYASPVITKNYFNTKTKNQIQYKELTNNSKLYLRSAFLTADGARGISTDMTVIDEVQDMVSDNIPVIEQAMSHSIQNWKIRIPEEPDLPRHFFNYKNYAGTPKTSDNVMEVYWEASTQCEWLIKCTHCGKYNYINLENIGPTCLVCNGPKCKKPIHYRDGNWVAMNPGGLIEAYRMPQIALDWVNNEDAWIEQIIKPIETGVYSTEKVYNEMLALPYANARHPITAADIRACCNPDREAMREEDAMSSQYVRDENTFAGIDWGKGDTASGTSYSVLTIGTWEDNKFKVLYVKKFTGRLSDAILQIEEMKRIIYMFRCGLIIADYGDGRTSNAMMVAEFGPQRFAELYEHGTAKNTIRWDAGKSHYIINRTQMMTDLMMEIKRKQIELFKHEEFKQYQRDFTGIYSEYSEQTRLTKYDHNVPDDCFHSYMFSRIACGVIHGHYAKYLNGGQ